MATFLGAGLAAFFAAGFAAFFAAGLAAFFATGFAFATGLLLDLDLFLSFALAFAISKNLAAKVTNLLITAILIIKRQ
ncbi:MAG: hypothetical protein U0T75_02900 [Chitinophagales bacterium]